MSTFVNNNNHSNYEKNDYNILKCNFFNVRRLLFEMCGEKREFL